MASGQSIFIRRVISKPQPQHVDMVSVQLYVYDLSNGMARQLSRQMMGRQIDGIWQAVLHPDFHLAMIMIHS